jgi:hypothetical protein
METNEQLKIFLQENNLMRIDHDQTNTVYKMEYNLGNAGTIEIDDITVEGEYITRLLSLNPYTVVYINGVEKKLTVVMDNPL